MSSPPGSPHTAMSPSEIIDLFHALRNANTRSSNSAAAFRRTRILPTHHARKHARELCLSIDIQAASELDQSQISSIPLPVLDSAPSPTAEKNSANQVEGHAARICAFVACKVFAPIPRYHSEIEVDNPVTEVIVRPVRPKLMCAISSSGQRNAMSPASVYSLSSLPGGLKSRWSATTVGDAEEQDEWMQVDVPQDAESKIKISFVHKSEINDIPASPSYDFEDAFASLRPRFAVDGFARARISLPPMLLSKPARRQPMPTHIPRNPNGLDRHPPRCSDMPMLNSSGSDTSQSSSLGPSTPVSPR